MREFSVKMPPASVLLARTSSCLSTRMLSIATWMSDEQTKPKLSKLGCKSLPCHNSCSTQSYPSPGTGTSVCFPKTFKSSLIRLLLSGHQEILVALLKYLQSLTACPHLHTIATVLLVYCSCACSPPAFILALLQSVLTGSQSDPIRT